jgi:hypothetical protein
MENSRRLGITLMFTYEVEPTEYDRDPKASMIIREISNLVDALRHNENCRGGITSHRTVKRVADDGNHLIDLDFLSADDVQSMIQAAAFASEYEELFEEMIRSGIHGPNVLRATTEEEVAKFMRGRMYEVRTIVQSAIRKWATEFHVAQMRGKFEDGLYDKQEEEAS